MADPLASRSSETVKAPPAIGSRAALLRSLTSLACTQAIAQLEPFVARLSDALLKLATQTVRSDDAGLGRDALQHLERNTVTFHRLVTSCLAELLTQEIAAIEHPQESRLEQDAIDLSLVTFEAMEHKVLLDNLAQALDAATADTLRSLNIRIAYLLQREEIGTAQNPFRPAVFLQAVSDAWGKFDLNTASHMLVMRQMRPELFLQLEPVLQALNDALIGHGILPNLADAYRLRKTGGKPQRSAHEERRNLPLYSKLRNWLSLPGGGGTGGGVGGTGGGAGGAGNASGGAGTMGTTGLAGLDDGGIAVHPGLVQYLTDLQQQIAQLQTTVAQSVEVSTAVLRQIVAQAPAGTLMQSDANAIELLAKTFDHLFAEQHIPTAIKKLLAQVQIPLLKAALTDKDFFFSEDHPARRFLDAVARSSVAFDHQQGQDDPLYKMIEHVVDRVQQEYDQQIGLFDDVVNELEAFLAKETQASGDALSQAIAEAERQEKISRARELAEKDVAERTETGEVPGFVEAFLETQWTRVLGLAHSVRETRPDALPNALKTMDDLIWSLKPKTSPEERKELVGKLPALLSMVNAWLNVVKWEGPDRVTFFSTLAQRHAAIVRTAVELSPRHQLEISMTVLQRVSERRLNQRAMPLPEKIIDKYVYMVDALETGTWMEFLNNSGALVKYKLAWASQQRKRFVFADRQGQQPFTLTFDELAQLLRDQKAVVTTAEAAVDRALAAALEEVSVG